MNSERKPGERRTMIRRRKPEQLVGTFTNTTSTREPPTEAEILADVERWARKLIREGRGE